MEEKNNKISAFQFATIGAFLANALFVGIGIINIFVLSKQDAWIVTILAFVFGLMSIFIIIYIINYKPDMNILEKNKIIFGKIIGNIINFIICSYIFFILAIVIHSSTVFATTMYLTKTPNIVIAGIIVLTGIYAVIKGIETIGRTSEILFFMAIIIVSIIVLSLLPSFHFDDLKPVMADGFKPIIKNSFIYFSYTFSPLIILGIIPKNNIINNKNYHKYLIGGFIIGALLMFIVFFIIPGVITPTLTALYRFPAYYVQRKISIGGAINNVENFTSVHWFFNVLLMIMMSIYFLSKYITDLFKIKKKKNINIASIIIGIVVIIAANYTFKNPASILEFMIDKFPYYVMLILLAILLITCLIIFIRKRLEKRVT